MSKHTTTECLLFPDLLDKPVVVQFDQEHSSSDGGALLLKAADRRLGLLDRLSACQPDTRQEGKLTHSLTDLVAQRAYGIACGYSDCNDAARLADDPIHKALLGRDPIDGDALASQSTLSRFENAVGPKDLYRFGEALADVVIQRHRKRLHGKAKRITIDLDPTDDPTHGRQQLTLFNGYYDSWCYLPILGFVSFNDEMEQYLFTAVLRPGNAPATLGAVGILRRVIDRLRDAFPGVYIQVRLDGGFACPAVLDFLDEQSQLGRPRLRAAAADDARRMARSARPINSSRSGSSRTRHQVWSGARPSATPRAARWTLPLSVLLSVPIAMLGAALASLIMGMQNNIYMQIGLVLLVGLSAKSAIMIVEFANQPIRAAHRGLRGLNVGDRAIPLRLERLLLNDEQDLAPAHERRRLELHGLQESLDPGADLDLLERTQRARELAEVSHVALHGCLDNDHGRGRRRRRFRGRTGGRQSGDRRGYQRCRERAVSHDPTPIVKVAAILPPGAPATPWT